jgi:4-hydroxybenzoate polyprenyltransferase
MLEGTSNRAQTPPPVEAAERLMQKVRVTLEMIKFEHSVFALPFALIGAMLAVHGWPAWRQIFWLIVAMVAARSAAMTFNRVVDRKMDALNPRTRMRALPTGRLSLRFAVGFTVVSSAVLVLAAWELNRLAFELSPIALAILLLYSYAKRFTLFTHLILGIADGLSPIAAWIAVRGDISRSAILLGAAVALWVAGFDLIYACQDVEFDRGHGVHSVPRRFGVATALYASIAFHAAMLTLLVVVARMEHLGVIAFAGVGLIGALLGYEHWLVRPKDLSRVNAAFFTINGYISILFFVTWGAALLIH